MIVDLSSKVHHAHGCQAILIDFTKCVLHSAAGEVQEGREFHSTIAILPNDKQVEVAIACSNAIHFNWNVSCFVATASIWHDRYIIFLFDECIIHWIE